MMSETHDVRHPPRHASLLQQLSSCDLFRGVSAEALARLADFCREIELDAGTVLLTPDQWNDCLYIVLEGKLSVHLGPELPEVATISPGECVGELSIIDGRGVSAIVVAAADARLLEITSDVLWSLIEASHGVARNLLHILATRVRKDNRTILESLARQRQFEQAATVDGLTGIHNRRWMDEHFPRALHRCAQASESVVLLMIDIDHFKRCNDMHGHQAGDEVLRHVARMMIRGFRPHDLLARFGGEEFAALLPNAGLENGRRAADRVRASIAAKPVTLGEGRVLPAVTVSVGVAAMRSGEDLASLLAQADAALYTAKRNGRNRVEVAGLYAG